jgi:hypothetical protein
MGALIDKTALLHQQDQIGVSDMGHAMRDDQKRRIAALAL